MKKKFQKKKHTVIVQLGVNVMQREHTYDKQENMSFQEEAVVKP